MICGEGSKEDLAKTDFIAHPVEDKFFYEKTNQRN